MQSRCSLAGQRWTAGTKMPRGVCGIVAVNETQTVRIKNVHEFTSDFSFSTISRVGLCCSMLFITSYVPRKCYFKSAFEAS